MEADASHEPLDRLAALHEAATPGPWHSRPLNDDLCMSGVGVATEPDRMFEERGFIDPDWPVAKMVAVRLSQEPPLAILDDRRWNKNTELIATMRTALPEPLRLARIGLEHENAERA